MTSWPKTFIEWSDGDTAYVSVPFTWLLEKAASRCVALKQDHARVRIGGPAVAARPDFPPGLSSIAEVGGHVDALRRHNPDATMTSRGCIRGCSFCAVPRIEGGIIELKTWDPRPIVCDNNLLACSQAHFDRVIDSLKPLKGVDFNQGLDARLVTPYHAGRIAELHIEAVRLSWDHVNEESAIMRAIEVFEDAGFHRRRIKVYVLIGYEVHPDDAFYRLQTLKDRCIRASPQRYQSPTATKKNQDCGVNWTPILLAAYMHYWYNQRRYEHIPFQDFKRGRRTFPDYIPRLEVYGSE